MNLAKSLISGLFSPWKILAKLYGVSESVCVSGFIFHLAAVYRGHVVRDRDKLTGEFFFYPSRVYDARVTVSAEAGCVCIRYKHCAQRYVITDAGRRNNVHQSTCRRRRLSELCHRFEIF